MVLDDNAIRQVPRPGTSLRTAATPSADIGGTSQAYRPTTQSGIVISIVTLLGLQQFIIKLKILPKYVILILS